jgi:hypothetical protein
MDLTTFDLNPDNAKAKAAELNATLRKRKLQPQERTLLNTYRALARELPVIDIHTAIGGAGLNAQGLPHLAIARADASLVRVRCWTTGAVYITTEAGGGTVTGQVTRRRIHIPESSWPEGYRAACNSTLMGANVPVVPAQFHDIYSPESDYILFEAEWRDVPPHESDPALLRHLGGVLFAVLAEWDVTPLEAAALRGYRFAN